MSEEAIENIKNRTMRLSGDKTVDAHPHRPDLNVWASWDEGITGDDPDGCVTITVGSLWGQSGRFVVLSRDEARQLANHLRNVVQEIDAVMPEDAQ